MAVITLCERLKVKQVHNYNKEKEWGMKMHVHSRSLILLLLAESNRFFHSKGELLLQACVVFIRG